MAARHDHAGRAQASPDRVRRAALVCPVNEELQRAIERHGIHARFRIVPNAVDTSVFHPGPAASREPARLVNVAFHEEKKGLEFLLRAFAQIAERRPTLTLELIGEGPLTASLKRLAAELGADERVRFTGSAAPAEVAEALRAADVFVLSSLSENLPVALLEALCSGLPVVATCVGGVEGAVGGDGEPSRPATRTRSRPHWTACSRSTRGSTALRSREALQSVGRLTRLAASGTTFTARSERGSSRPGRAPSEPLSHGPRAIAGAPAQGGAAAGTA